MPNPMNPIFISPSRSEWPVPTAYFSNTSLATRAAVIAAGQPA
jgi:hypothetical protein